MLLIGVGITLLGGYLLFNGVNVSLFSLIPVILGGIALTLAGWGAITGERIRDILAFLFTGMP